MQKKVPAKPSSDRAAAAKVLGSAKSPAKAAASKANGAKGGRKAGVK